MKNQKNQNQTAFEVAGKEFGKGFIGAIRDSKFHCEMDVTLEEKRTETGKKMIFHAEISGYEKVIRKKRNNKKDDIEFDPVY